MRKLERNQTYFLLPINFRSKILDQKTKFTQIKKSVTSDFSLLLQIINFAVISSIAIGPVVTHPQYNSDSPIDGHLGYFPVTEHAVIH
jgi:hypothetical protein